MSKKVIYCLLGFIFVFFLIIVFSTYAFSHRKPDVVEEEKKGGDIILNYTSVTPSFSVQSIVPTVDSLGISATEKERYYDFSVQVNLDKAKYIEYEVAATVDKSFSTISNEDIRIYLEKENSGSYTKVFGPSEYKALKKDSELGSKKGSMVLVTTKDPKPIVDNYRLRMWLSDKSLTPLGNYKVTISVHGVAK